MPPGPRRRSVSALLLLIAVAFAVAVPAGTLLGAGSGQRSPTAVPTDLARPPPFFASPTSLSVPEPTVTNQTLDVGQSTQFSAAAAGGSPPYTFLWVGLPTGCSSENASVIGCTPSANGNATVSVSVTDTHGTNVASPAVNVTVNPRLVITVFTGSATTVVVGENLSFMVEASGGTATLSYAWTGLPDGCDIRDTPEVQCAPDAPGNYLVIVTVIDHVGQRVYASQGLTVTGQPPPQHNPPPNVTLASFLPLISVFIAAAVALTAVFLLGRKRGPPPPH
jgi:hypothetical protein